MDSYKRQNPTSVNVMSLSTGHEMKPLKHLSLTTLLTLLKIREVNVTINLRSVHSGPVHPLQHFETTR